MIFPSTWPLFFLIFPLTLSSFLINTGFFYIEPIQIGMVLALPLTLTNLQFRSFKFSLNKNFYVFSFFFLIAAISSILFNGQFDYKFMIVRIFRYLTLIVYAFLIIINVQNKKDIERLLKVLVISCVIAALIGITQAGIRISYGIEARTLLAKPAFFRNVNEYVTFILAGLFALIFFFARKKSLFSNVVDILLIGILSVAVLLTQSRLALLILALTFLSNILYKRILLITSFFSLLLGLFFIKFPQYLFLIIGRILATLGIKSESLNYYTWNVGKSDGQRLEMFKTSIQGLLENPMNGVGVSNFERSFDIASHNTFLTILIETGAIGFSLFTLATIIQYQTVLKSNIIKQYKVFFVSFFTIYLFTNLFHDFGIHEARYWLFVALGFGLLNIESDYEKSTVY